MENHIKVVTFGTTLDAIFDVNTMYDPGCDEPRQAYPCLVKKLLINKIGNGLNMPVGKAYFAQSRSDKSFYYRFHDADNTFMDNIMDLKDNIYFITSPEFASEYYNFVKMKFKMVNSLRTHTKIFFVDNDENSLLLMGSRTAKKEATNDIDLLVTTDMNLGYNDIIDQYHTYFDYLLNLCVWMDCKKTPSGECEIDDEGKKIIIYSYRFYCPSL